MKIRLPRVLRPEAKEKFLDLYEDPVELKSQLSAADICPDYFYGRLPPRSLFPGELCRPWLYERGPQRQQPFPRQRYGQIVINWQRKPLLSISSTHVAMYLAHGVLVPDGYQVDHLCCIPRCNEDLHLEIVTKEENAAREAMRVTMTRVSNIAPVVWEQLIRYERAWIGLAERRYRRLPLKLWAIRKSLDPIQNSRLVAHARYSYDQGYNAPNTHKEHKNALEDANKTLKDVNNECGTWNYSLEPVNNKRGIAGVKTEFAALNPCELDMVPWTWDTGFTHCDPHGIRLTTRELLEVAS